MAVFVGWLLEKRIDFLTAISFMRTWIPTSERRIRVRMVCRWILLDMVLVLGSVHTRRVGHMVLGTGALGKVLSAAGLDAV
jgi:hypothetical protein